MIKIVFMNTDRLRSENIDFIIRNAHLDIAMRVNHFEITELAKMHKNITINTCIDELEALTSGDPSAIFARLAELRQMLNR